MIKVLERSAGNVIGFEVQGEISIKQFREIEPPWINCSRNTTRSIWSWS